MLYIVVFNGDTRLTAHEIDTVFAVFDDIIEDVTDCKNRVGISDNGFIVVISQAIFPIFLPADIGYFFIFCTDLNILCMDNHC